MQQYRHCHPISKTYDDKVLGVLDGEGDGSVSVPLLFAGSGEYKVREVGYVNGCD